MLFVHTSFSLLYAAIEYRCEGHHYRYTSVFRLFAVVNSLRVVLRARASLRPSERPLKRSLHLRFCFTSRKDGWEVRGRRVEINFDETRSLSGKFFFFFHSAIRKPRASQRKSRFPPVHVRGKFTPSLSRLSPFCSLARRVIGGLTRW